MAVSLPKADVSALVQSGNESTMATGGACPVTISSVADAAQDRVRDRSHRTDVDYYYNDIEDFWRALNKRSDEFWKTFENFVDEVKKMCRF